MLAQPLLRALDLRVAVIALAFEHDVRREPVVMPLQREQARDFLRGRGARVARDQVQHHVVPGDEAPELTSSSRTPEIISTRSG